MGTNIRQDYTAYTVDEYAQLAAIMAHGEDRIPICFCIDISSSMGLLTNRPEDYTFTDRKKVEDGNTVTFVDMKPGKVPHTRIEELKRVMKDMINRMNHIPILQSSAIVYVITFSRFADPQVGPTECKDISMYHIDHINIGTDSTNAASGINLALEKLDFLSRAIKEASVSSYHPVLIFMSDGKPTDDAAATIAGNELCRRSEANEMNVIPIAIGEDLDLNWMRSLSKTGKVYRMKYEDEFDEVFNTITRRIVRTAVAMPLDAVLVENEMETPAPEEENVDSSRYGRTSSLEEMQSFLRDLGI